jgi:putative spermidine/putrescine transport system substrate-binding protein
MKQAITISALMLGLALGSAARAEGILPDAVRDGASGEIVWHDGSGGLTTRAREATIMKSYGEETGATVRSDYNSDMTKFFAAMDSGATIPWSMVEFPTKGDFLRAVQAGYLEKLDPAIVDISLLAEGSYDEYGVDVMNYGILLTFNTEAFAGKPAPTSMADLYDTEKFPGKRCLFNYPQFGGVLESALLADGVAKDELYPLDLDRAFAKLDTIKSDIVWWSNGDDAVRLLASGDCSMGIAWSGRVYGAVVNDKAPLKPIWDDSLYAQAVYAVPKGAPNAAAGQALIQYWLADVEGQKNFVAQIPYTTNLKALGADAYGPDLAAWLPAGDNLKGAVQEDADYYLKNLTDVVDRFNRWVALN